MTSIVRVFVDTNVLIYASVLSSPYVDIARNKLVALRDSGSELWISRQIIREYLVVMTRARQGEPLPEKEPVLAQVNAMLNTFEVADETPDVTNWLITLLKQTPTAGKQVHDANVVATMLAYGIDTLLTANIGDFVRFEDKITLMALMGKDI
jgi:predicted nucleic acid-binding protein